MIHIAICDDEEVFVEKIRSEARTVLETQDEDFEIFCYTDGNKLLADYEAKKFDLVLLDIDMPDVDGFEVALTLKNICPNIDISFVSSKEYLVFDSFQYSPFSFIPKENMNFYIAKTMQLYIKKREYANKTLTFSLKNEDRDININSIVYFSSLGHDIDIKMNDGTFLTLKRRKYSMSVIENMINDTGFIKIHKSFLVNFEYIAEILYNTIKLKDGEKIGINPKKYQEIKQCYAVAMRRYIVK